MSTPLFAKTPPPGPASRPWFCPPRDFREVDPKVWKELREPFPASQIGHKPSVWCGACRDSQQKVCGGHSKIKCSVCRQNITSAHIDLDFVGHAAVTQRLLEVDPLWAWWPMPEEERKELNFPEPGPKGMWIWLDIHGQVRPGLGETEGGLLAGANQTKALMSDAIKNASMRFGVAIETWSKEDLAAEREREKDQADREARGDVAGGESGDSPEASGELGRNWAQEIGTAETQEAFEALCEEAKLAGALTGAASAAARTQKAKFAKLAKDSVPPAAAPAADS